MKPHGAHFVGGAGSVTWSGQTLQKQLKKNFTLSLELYDTGIYDAMYLTGLIAEPERMTKKDLARLVKKASKPIASYVVGPIAAASPAGSTLALAWIKSRKGIENIAGWATLSAAASIHPDEELDLDEYQRLLWWFALSKVNLERSANALVNECSQARIALQIDCADSQRCTLPFNFRDGNERFAGFWTGPPPPQNQFNAWELCAGNRTIDPGVFRVIPIDLCTCSPELA